VETEWDSVHAMLEGEEGCVELASPHGISEEESTDCCLDECSL
jgi:hypothetical protein